MYECKLGVCNDSMGEDVVCEDVVCEDMMEKGCLFKSRKMWCNP